MGRTAGAGVIPRNYNDMHLTFNLDFTPVIYMGKLFF